MNLGDGYTFYPGPPPNLSGWRGTVDVRMGRCSVCLQQIANGRSYVPDNELPAEEPVLEVDPEYGHTMCWKHVQEAFEQYRIGVSKTEEPKA